MMHRRTITIIAVLAAIIPSLLFIVVRPITSNYIVAYVFILITVAGVLITSLDIVSKHTGYPWIVALPTTFFIYSIWTTIIFVANLLLEQFAKWSLPLGWLVLIEFLILALYAIRFVALVGAKNQILERDNEIQVKSGFIKNLVVELELFSRKFEDPRIKEELKNVVDQARYSDPMSNPSLLAIEQEIEHKVLDLKHSAGGDPTEEVLTRIKSVQDLLIERAMKCKLLK